MRTLTERETSTYRNDGVVLVKNAVSTAWVQRLMDYADAQLAKPSRWANDGNPDAAANRFFTDRHQWGHNETVHDFVYHSGVAQLAAQAMGSSQLRFYFDHLLVKEPNTPVPTPWHQDLPYWPFLGRQVCSVWLALTPATVANSAMEFVRGSHQWAKYYKPEVFGERDDHPSAWQRDGEGERVPDIEANREDFEIIGFDVEPGDAVLFSAWTLHWAPGNSAPDQRRIALSTRWLGDDVTWHPHEGADPIVTQAHVRARPGEPLADEPALPRVI